MKYETYDIKIFDFRFIEFIYYRQKYCCPDRCSDQNKMMQFGSIMCIISANRT